MSLTTLASVTVSEPHRGAAARYEVDYNPVHTFSHKCGCHPQNTTNQAYHHHNKAHAITSVLKNAVARSGMQLLREGRSHLKPADRDSHTK